MVIVEIVSQSLLEFVVCDRLLFVEMRPSTILNKEETWQPISVVKPKMHSLKQCRDSASFLDFI